MTAFTLNRRSEKISEQSERITAIYDKLRNGVVTLDNGWRVDADRDSVITMQETIENWSVLIYTRNNGKQIWKDADNVLRELDYEQFVAFVAEVRAKRAASVDAYFGFMMQKKAALPLPDNDPIFDAANWPGQ